MKQDRQQQAQEQQKQRIMLQSLADAYQRDREVQQQVSMMQLDLLAVNAGVADLWEVQLFPGPEVYGQPVSVAVPARDSRAATQQALSRYPGYVAGAAHQSAVELSMHPIQQAAM